MKINTLKKTKGLTLIELTVVIVVLLGLVSVLFISAQAWINGSNAAKCVVNLSSLQKAAYSYYNMNNRTSPADVAALGTAGMFSATCPNAGTYSFPTVTDSGVTPVCSYVATDARHKL